jgi:CheY-like chemotaxis protein
MRPLAAVAGELRLRPTKILVVDDSKLVHKMYEVILKDYPLVHALDGVEALQQLAGHPTVDLILLDINMPRMNGLQFLAHVKAHQLFRHIPVVIISTEGTEEDTLRGLKAGAAAYIKKPFQNEAILEVIGRLQAGTPPGPG